MRKTKRPQNVCSNCNHRWYPRNRNLSLKCPKCGSNGTTKVGIGGILLLLFLGILLFNCNGKTNHVTTGNQKEISN